MKGVSRKKTWLFMAFLTTILIVGGFVMARALSLNEKIVASDLPISLRVLTETLWPPEDLYDRIGRAYMVAEGSRWTTELTLIHRYPGPYLVRVVSDDGRFIGADRGEYSVRCVSEQGSFVETGVVRGSLMFYDLQKEKWREGSVLSDYNIPEHFAPDEVVKCTIEIVERDWNESLVTPEVLIGRISQL